MSEELKLNKIEAEKLRELAQTQREMLMEIRQKERALHQANEKDMQEKIAELRKEEREVRQKVEREMQTIAREQAAKMESEQRARASEHREMEERVEREMQAQEREMRMQEQKMEREIHRQYVSGYGDGKMQKRLEEEMLADKLINNTKAYQFELSSETLKINGKKQSSALHKKYLDIYREVAGDSLEGKSKLVIDKTN